MKSVGEFRRYKVCACVCVCVCMFCMMVSETVKYSGMVGRKVTAISGTRRVKAW